MYFMFRVLIVHCSGLSSGRERVRRARVIIALSLATCQYNLEAVREDGREGREKREKRNIEKSRGKGIKERKERKAEEKGRGERYTYERKMDEEGRRSGGRKKRWGKERRERGINANTTKESRKTVLLTIVKFKNPFLNMSNVHVELTGSCNL